jgi:DNA-binding LacI/PurR family transcriptional regulator
MAKRSKESTRVKDVVEFLIPLIKGGGLSGLSSTFKTTDLQKFIEDRSKTEDTHWLHPTLPTMRRVVTELTELDLLRSAGKNGLRVSPPRAIGFVAAEINDPFLGPVLQGVLGAARMRHRQVIVTDTQMDPDVELRAIQELMEGQQIEGVILVPAREGNRWREIAELQVKHQKQLVFLERFIPDLPQFKVIASNNFQGGYEAGRHLFEQLRSINGGGDCHFFIAGRERTTGQLLRQQGNEEAIRRAAEELRIAGKLSCRIYRHEPIWIRPQRIGYKIYKTRLAEDLNEKRTYTSLFPDEDERAKRGSFFDILDAEVQQQRRVAVFCMADAIAAAFLGVMRDHGRKVPEEALVVGYDDLFFAAPLGLTTIVQQFERIGEAAVAELMQDKTLAPDSYQTKLEPRATSAIPGAGGGGADSGSDGNGSE